MRALRIMLNSIAMVDVDSDTSALREAVGGEIETVGLRDGGVMIVNRDGMQQQFPHNDTASCISGRHIYGTALIVGADGDDFDDMPEQYLPLLGLGE